MCGFCFRMLAVTLSDFFFLDKLIWACPGTTLQIMPVGSMFSVCSIFVPDKLTWACAGTTLQIMPIGSTFSIYSIVFQTSWPECVSGHHTADRTNRQNILHLFHLCSRQADLSVCLGTILQIMPIGSTFSSCSICVPDKLTWVCMGTVLQIMPIGSTFSICSICVPDKLTWVCVWAPPCRSCPVATSLCWPSAMAANWSSSTCSQQSMTGSATSRSPPTWTLSWRDCARNWAWPFQSSHSRS